MGAGAWRTMYTSDAINVLTTPENSPEDGCPLQITTPNGHAADPCEAKDSTAPNGPPKGARIADDELKQRYSKALANDNLVIVEAPRPATPPPTQQPPKSDTYCNGGGQIDRAGRTLRGLADEELPQPDVVRKAKDVFETLATKHRQEASLRRHQSSAQDLGRPRSGATIGRSQSMVVLTGRAWCNGAPLVSPNGTHRHGACSACANGARSLVRSGAYGRKGAPPFQRSCSELDKFFQEDDDDDDPWERHARNERGSPVSPEAIEKIRGHGTCVKFFGSDAYVVESAEDDANGDAFPEESNGYLLEYPYELSPTSSSGSPSPAEDKPKIVGTLPKTPNGSCASSLSSAYGGRETPSPAPPSPYGGYGGWYLGGCGVTLDEIRASLRADDSDGSCSLGSGYVRLKPLNGNRLPAAMGRCHGKWVKNPYWQGSYYVVYDFTQKPAEPQFPINGN